MGPTPAIVSSDRKLLPMTHPSASAITEYTSGFDSSYGHKSGGHFPAEGKSGGKLWLSEMVLKRLVADRATRRRIFRSAGPQR